MGQSPALELHDPHEVERLASHPPQLLHQHGEPPTKRGVEPGGRHVVVAVRVDRSAEPDIIGPVVPAAGAAATASLRRATVHRPEHVGTRSRKREPSEGSATDDAGVDDPTSVTGVQLGTTLALRR